MSYFIKSISKLLYADVSEANLYFILFMELIILIYEFINKIKEVIYWKIMIDMMFAGQQVYYVQ